MRRVFFLTELFYSNGLFVWNVIQLLLLSIIIIYYNYREIKQKSVSRSLIYIYIMEIS